MKRLFNWARNKVAAEQPPSHKDLGRTGAYMLKSGAHRLQPTVGTAQAARKSKPDLVRLDPHVEGTLDDLGPGKNVFVRKKYVREDSGTHDTLKILDESVIDADDDIGIDPYNTGQFDRSKNWDKRFRN
jgi:hypothetical protein